MSTAWSTMTSATLTDVLGISPGPRNPAQAQSRLMRLPAELRIKIYTYTVASEPVVVSVESTYRAREPPEASHETSEPRQYHYIRRLKLNIPPLLLTCHTMMTEVKPIYFEDNMFLFTDKSIRPQALATFRRIAGQHAHYIKNVKVMTRVYHNQRESASSYVRFELTHIKSEKRLEIKTRTQGGLCWCSTNAAGHTAYYGDEQKPCYCRLKNLARKLGKDDDSVLQFLEAWARLPLIEGTY